ncbi:hypothetical protein DFJ73DRAFT_839475 [Zopfochytrium polystomum]|nr:hypothetical protein DFJ73DRAFT_839475 [Zopfochytrium polystomum]
MAVPLSSPQMPEEGGLLAAHEFNLQTNPQPALPPSALHAIMLGQIADILALKTQLGAIQQAIYDLHVQNASARADASREHEKTIANAVQAASDASQAALSAAIESVTAQTEAKIAAAVEKAVELAVTATEHSVAEHIAQAGKETSAYIERALKETRETTDAKIVAAVRAAAVASESTCSLAVANTESRCFDAIQKTACTLQGEIAKTIDHVVSTRLRKIEQAPPGSPPLSWCEEFKKHESSLGNNDHAKAEQGSESEVSAEEISPVTIAETAVVSQSNIFSEHPGLKPAVNTITQRSWDNLIAEAVYLSSQEEIQTTELRSNNTNSLPSKESDWSIPEPKRHQPLFANNEGAEISKPTATTLKVDDEPPTMLGSNDTVSTQSEFFVNAQAKVEPLDTLNETSRAGDSSVKPKALEVSSPEVGGEIINSHTPKDAVLSRFVPGFVARAVSGVVPTGVKTHPWTTRVLSYIENEGHKPFLDHLRTAVDNVTGKSRDNLTDTVEVQDVQRSTPRTMSASSSLANFEVLLWSLPEPILVRVLVDASASSLSSDAAITWIWLRRNVCKYWMTLSLKAMKAIYTEIVQSEIRTLEQGLVPPLFDFVLDQSSSNEPFFHRLSEKRQDDWSDPRTMIPQHAGIELWFSPALASDQSICNYTLCVADKSGSATTKASMAMVSLPSPTAVEFSRPTQTFRPASPQAMSTGTGVIQLIWTGPVSSWRSDDPVVWDFLVRAKSGGLTSPSFERVSLKILPPEEPQNLALQLLGGRQVLVRCKVVASDVERQMAVNPSWRSQSGMSPMAAVGWIWAGAGRALGGSAGKRASGSEKDRFEKWRAAQETASYAVQIEIEEVDAPISVLFGGLC